MRSFAKAKEGSVVRGQRRRDGRKARREIQEGGEKNNENGTVEHQKWKRGQAEEAVFERNKTKGDGEEP